MHTRQGPTVGSPEGGARSGDTVMLESYPVKCASVDKATRFSGGCDSLLGLPTTSKLSTLELEHPRHDLTLKIARGRQERPVLPEGASTSASNSVLMGRGGWISSTNKPQVAELFNLLDYFDFVQLYTIISVLAELIISSSQWFLLFLKAKKIISPNPKEYHSPFY